MGVYRVTTDGGTYDVTTDDGGGQPTSISNNPAYQGGANSPANIQAQQALAQAQKSNNTLDPQIGAVGAAYNATWPASRLAMMAMSQGNTPVPQATTSGGKLLQDAGAVANPLTQAAVGLAGKAIGIVGGTLEQLPAAVNPAKAAQLAQSIRGAFVGVKKAAVDKFGSDIDNLATQNPDKTVSLTNVVDDINKNWQELSNNAKTAFKNTPILKDFVKQEDGAIPVDADKVSLSDVQKIINHLNTKVPANIKANDLDLLNTLHDVRASQLDAFPEMASVKSDYAKVAQPYKDVQNYFRFNRVLNGIKGDFGGDEGQQAVNKLLPSDVLKNIGNYKNALGVVDVAKKAAIATGVGALGYGGFEGAKHLIK